MNQPPQKTGATRPATAPAIANGVAYTSEKKMGLQTKFQRDRQKHDQAVYDRYQALMAQPGAMATAVQAKVMREFDLHARSTVYRTVERVEQQIGGNLNPPI